MERHTETRPEGRGWAFIVMGLVWSWGGIYRTVWRPGIGSAASWQGISVVLLSGLGVAAALSVLKSVSCLGRDRRVKILIALLSPYWIVMAIFVALSFVPATSKMSDFYTYSISTLLGAANLLMGLELFLEDPRGQNPGWLYLLAGLIPLLVGMVGIILQPRGTGVPISWTGVLASCAVGFYLLAVSFILRFSPEVYRGKRRGCGNLMTLLAYKTFGMLLLAFYLVVMPVFFGLSFVSTMPETGHFCLYAGWMLLGAGAVWLGVSRIRHWGWI